MASDFIMTFDYLDICFHVVIISLILSGEPSGKFACKNITYDPITVPSKIMLIPIHSR